MTLAHTPQQKQKVVYLLLEASMQQLLQPRVYKKHADVFVDATAKSILVLILVVGSSSDAISGSQTEGGASRGASQPFYTCQQGSLTATP